jgi:DNA-binding response OmpR family regulator
MQIMSPEIPKMRGDHIRKKLLYVDFREEKLAECKYFFELCGYEVIAATNGPQGLRLLAQTSVDAIVLKYELSEEAGLGVAIAMKILRPETPIVFISDSLSECDIRALSVAGSIINERHPFPELLAGIQRLFWVPQKLKIEKIDGAQLAANNLGREGKIRRKMRMRPHLLKSGCANRD